MNNLKNNLKKYYSTVKMPSGKSFDTVKTIKKGYAYYDGELIGRDKDSNGITKDVYNITKSTCDVASKFVDIDIKNILFLSDGTNLYETTIMQKDFKQWAKDSEFAILLNEIKDHYPRGHVVLKKVNNKYERVPISNLRFNVGSKDLYSSDFVYEIIRMNKYDIEAMNWNQPENIKQVLDRKREENSILVYECYEKQAKGYKREIKADVLTRERNGIYVETAEEQYLKGQGEKTPALTLHKDEVDNIPYRELVWERKDGRLLGYGYPEYLFTNQRRMNEIKHLEKLVMYLKALHLVVSDDENIGNSLLKGLNIGQIIKTVGSFNPVRFDNVDTSSYQYDKEDWMKNKTQKTFDTDISRGDNLPSQTPLGLGELQAQMTASFFEGKTENFGLFIKKLLYDDILPEFRKKQMKSHIVAITDKDPEYKQLYDITVQGLLADYIQQYVDRGLMPDLEAIEAARAKIENNISQRGVMPIEVPDNFYKNIKLIDIVITGESVNIQQRFQALQETIKLLASSPQILENPTIKDIFYQILQMQGITSVNLDLKQPVSAMTPTKQTLPTQPTQAVPQANSIVK